MPQPRTAKAASPSPEEKERIVVGSDPQRFYCPHPGCNRSFAELWRLKVHFRAPPDVRGSGKERGHGTELKFCPKCGKDLRPGKHHVGCSAGKSAPRQAAKRQRQQQMSTTTESAPGVTTATTTEHSSSWEQAVRRQAAKHHRLASEAESAQRSRRMDVCRIETLVQKLDARHVGGAELLFQSNPSNSDPALAPQQFFAGDGPAQPPQHYHPAQQQQQQAFAPQQQQQQGYGAQHPGVQQPAGVPQLELPSGGEMPGLRSLSPSPLDFFNDPFAGSNGHGGGQAGPEPAHAPPLIHEEDLRIPSPPPLPADWDVGPRGGMLFDFDQFDASKRHQPGSTAPLVTVTTAMSPVDMLNPSDDYIWQILFAGENDVVPKRVTAHLHHPPSTSLSYLDEGDPLLDSFLSEDLGPIPEHSGSQQGPQQHHQAAQQQPGSYAPLSPPQQQPQQQAEGFAPPSNGAAVHHPQQHHMQLHPQQGQKGLPSLDAVLHQHHSAQGLNGMMGHGAELSPPFVELEGSRFI